MMRPLRSTSAAALVTTLLLIAPCVRPLGAQDVRITGMSLARYVELRPIVEDSIAIALTTGAGLVRESPLGLVNCPDGQSQCYFYRSQERTHTIPLTQDVELSGWGLGQGVSVYAHVRASTSAGGVSQLWTREDDRFVALAAYLEVDRGRWLARVGRQWLTSQLGVNNFDGASLRVHPLATLELEGYAGASLVQGLSQALTGGLLSAVDVLPPDVGGFVIGTAARWRPAQILAVSAEYQRELRRDRAGLYAERVALDGTLAIAGTAITADVQADVASTAFNEVRIRASHPLPHQMNVGIEAIHSTPFFPLWTIWGVFSPVGFNEARGDARWHSVGNDLSLGLSGGYRRYQDTHTGVGFLPLRNDGWTVIGSGMWRHERLELSGSYRRDIGFGSSKSDGNGAVRWGFSDALWLGVAASAVQNIFEYRVGGGYVVGAALDGGMPLTSNLRLRGDLGTYRQIASNTPSTAVNWSQRRAQLRLEWSVGRDPGMRSLPAARVPKP